MSNKRDRYVASLSIVIISETDPIKVSKKLLSTAELLPTFYQQ